MEFDRKSAHFGVYSTLLDQNLAKVKSGAKRKSTPWRQFFFSPVWMENNNLQVYLILPNLPTRSTRFDSSVFPPLLEFSTGFRRITQNMKGSSSYWFHVSDLIKISGYQKSFQAHLGKNSDLKNRVPEFPSSSWKIFRSQKSSFRISKLIFKGTIQFSVIFVYRLDPDVRKPPPNRTNSSKERWNPVRISSTTLSFSNSLSGIFSNTECLTFLASERYDWV